jgi:hypothetical protein
MSPYVFYVVYFLHVRNPSMSHAKASRKVEMDVLREITTGKEFFQTEVLFC